MGNPIILYDNRFADGTPVATDTAEGYDVLNILDGRTYTHWVAAGPGTKDIVVDCGSPKSADCLGLVGHNFGTVAAAVSVRSSEDGADWTQRYAAGAFATDHAFLAPFASATARFWGLRMVTAAVAPELAVIYLGELLRFPSPPQTPYTPATEKVQVSGRRSKLGHFLGSVIAHTRLEIEAKFAYVTRSFAEGDYRAFWDGHASLMAPFFWSWDPDNYPACVYYVKVPDDFAFAAPLTVGGWVDSIALKMEGVKEL